MGIFNSNYNKPGPGVTKGGQNKGLNLFYEIFFRKFWNLLKLNLLYIVTALPTFAIVFFLAGIISNKLGADYTENIKAALQNASGEVNSVDMAKLSIMVDLVIRFAVSVLFAIFWGLGPVTAGLTYITRCYVMEEPVFMASDYFEAIKKNLKQSLIVYFIDIAMFLLFTYSFFIYSSLPAPISYARYILLALVFFYTMIHCFIYHLLVTYKLSIGMIFKNAALFTIPSFPWCLLELALAAFILLIFPAITVFSVYETLANICLVITILLLLLLIFSGTELMRQFNATQQIKKYIAEDADVERNT